MHGHFRVLIVPLIAGCAGSAEGSGTKTGDIGSLIERAGLKGGVDYPTHHMALDEYDIPMA